MHDNLTMPTVDTLKAYETLIAAKLPEEQAKAILEVVKTSQESGFENLATKTELKEGLAALREEIASLGSDLQINVSALRTEIYRVKFDLLKWVIPILLGQLGLTVAILFRLLR